MRLWQYTGGDRRWEDRYNAHVGPIEDDIAAVQVRGQISSMT